jgi:hypothetical protein
MHTGPLPYRKESSSASPLQVRRPRPLTDARIAPKSSGHHGAAASTTAGCIAKDDRPLKLIFAFNARTVIGCGGVTNTANMPANHISEPAHIRGACIVRLVLRLMSVWT